MDHRKAFKLGTVRFLAIRGPMAEAACLDLRSKLLKRFSKRLFRAVNVEVVGFHIGDGCDGGMEVVKAAVKFVGLDDVPSWPPVGSCGWCPVLA